MNDLPHEYDMSNTSVNPSQRTQTQILFGLVGAISTAIAFDVSVYRGHGYSGWAFFFAGSLLAYFVATLKTKSHPVSWLVAFLILLTTLRLVWLGTPFQCVLGLFLLATYGMTRNGMVPYLSSLWIYCFQSCFAVLSTLRDLIILSPHTNRKINHVTLLTIFLPACAVVVFGGIFIAANPDLVKWTEEIFISATKWLEGMNPAESLCFLTIFWLAAGQILPWLNAIKKYSSDLFSERVEEEAAIIESDLYSPIRNTLIAVNGLFVLYLVFEFQTLWFRELPKGFYYAGYAHQGAGWLTFALALATAMLSLIFRGSILDDPRLSKLKNLAWVWSAANMLLAISVMNRMWIYIDFNGMTRMRVVGLFGIATVVIGFLIVIWKIRAQKNFIWLLHRQLWAFVLAIYCLTMTPVDYLIHTYNANQILNGNLAPAVQITEHPVNLSGWMALVPLLDCEDEIIRDGVRARLESIMANNGSLSDSRRQSDDDFKHWTSYQIVRQQLLDQFVKTGLSVEARGRQAPIDEWEKFKEYAYQWY